MEKKKTKQHNNASFSVNIEIIETCSPEIHISWLDTLKSTKTEALNEACPAATVLGAGLSDVGALLQT